MSSFGRPCLDINSIKINTKKWKNFQTVLKFIPPVFHDLYKSILQEFKETKKKKKSTTTIIKSALRKRNFQMTIHYIQRTNKFQFLDTKFLYSTDLLEYKRYNYIFSINLLRLFVFLLFLALYPLF